MASSATKRAREWNSEEKQDENLNETHSIEQTKITAQQ